MSANFRPVEEEALRRTRRTLLASTNWPAYQRWANIFKAAITAEMREAERHVQKVERADETKGICR
jgi:hypothetical protein